MWERLHKFIIYIALMILIHIKVTQVFFSTDCKSHLTTHPSHYSIVFWGFSTLFLIPFTRFIFSFWWVRVLRVLSWWNDRGQSCSLLRIIFYCFFHKITSNSSYWKWGTTHKIVYNHKFNGNCRICVSQQVQQNKKKVFSYNIFHTQQTTWTLITFQRNFLPRKSFLNWSEVQSLSTKRRKRKMMMTLQQ